MYSYKNIYSNTYPRFTLAVSCGYIIYETKKINKGVVKWKNSLTIAG